VALQLEGKKRRFGDIQRRLSGLESSHIVIMESVLLFLCYQVTYSVDYAHVV